MYSSLLNIRDNRDRRVAREKKFNDEWDKAVEFLQEKGIVKAPPAPLRLPSAPSSSSVQGDEGKRESGELGSVNKEAQSDPSGISSPRILHPSMSARSL
jgi:hypothetical protein